MPCSPGALMAPPAPLRKPFDGVRGDKSELVTEQELQQYMLREQALIGQLLGLQAHVARECQVESGEAENTSLEP